MRKLWGCLKVTSSISGNGPIFMLNLIHHEHSLCTQTLEDDILPLFASSQDDPWTNAGRGSNLVGEAMEHGLIHLTKLKIL